MVLQVSNRVAALSLMIVVALALEVSAAPILSLSGAYGTGPANGSSGSTIMFSGGSVGNSSDGMTVTSYAFPFTSGMYLASNTTLDLAAFSTDPGTVSITSPLIFTEFNSSLVATGKYAQFNITAAGTLDAAVATGTVDFGFVVQLAYNDTSLDLGALGSLWSYIFSYNGINIAPGMPGTYTVPAMSSSASYTLVRSDIFPGGLPVPEPASILAWGLVIGMGVLGRRRYKSLTA